MSGFRGSDETLDREIATLEKISRIRLKRATAELHELDRDVRELKRERARRRAEVRQAAAAEIPTEGVTP